MAASYVIMKQAVSSVPTLATTLAVPGAGPGGLTLLFHNLPTIPAPESSLSHSFVAFANLNQPSQIGHAPAPSHPQQKSLCRSAADDITSIRTPGHTPISIVHPSVVINTNLESTRSTVLFELKPGEPSDDGQDGTNSRGKTPHGADKAIGGGSPQPSMVEAHGTR